jgi:hypothetical protein
MEQETINSYEKSLLLRYEGEIHSLIKHIGLKYKDTVSIGNSQLWCTEKKARLEPTKYLSSRIPLNQNGWYTYEIYLLPIEAESVKYLLISCPHPKLFSSIIDEVANFWQAFSPIFIVCNLISLCNIKFQDESDDFLYIRRMNAQILGEDNKKVVSIGLFGRNILKSATLRKILEFNSDNDLDVFSAKKMLIPNSIRLTYDDGKDRKNEEFSLNMDKFGNYSFFLRTLADFEKISYTFNFLLSKKCLNVESSESPLKRNIESLKYIEQ